ncbi:MAG: CGNR zinc finger domain-containing protein [Ferruginibacter sp.]
MQKERSLKTLPLDGGALPFHFINTVYAWKGENLHEYLDSYKDVLEWCRKVNLLPRKVLEGLESYSRLHLEKTGEAFNKLKEIRYLLYQLFSGVAVKEIPAAVLNGYNSVLHDALLIHTWVKRKNGAVYVPSDNATELLLPVYIILKESHDLLLHEDAHRIKECPRCGWIFLDTTKNNKRRWCNPSTCGSVDKTSRYYLKIKKINNTSS